jgi:hypothetical protein
MRRPALAARQYWRALRTFAAILAVLPESEDCFKFTGR